MTQAHNLWLCWTHFDVQLTTEWFKCPGGMQPRSPQDIHTRLCVLPVHGMKRAYNRKLDEEGVHSWPLATALDKRRIRELMCCSVVIDCQATAGMAFSHCDLSRATRDTLTKFILACLQLMFYAKNRHCLVLRRSGGVLASMDRHYEGHFPNNRHNFLANQDVTTETVPAQ